ncbi:tetratricopeptide repeat protein [Actinokineospora soli]|uniref:Tetratricopeptide repeat protein n=1 Tax=Actinokineospora soli TaxID=1048753 RepID=A0ABW2TR14_9PSEU
MWLEHGPAGQGKTRLATQLGHELPPRWSVFWPSHTATPHDLAGAVADLALPTLIVLDYAETRPEQVTAVLSAIPPHSEIKVLMLARVRGPWVDELATVDDTVADHLATHFHHALDPLPQHNESTRQQPTAYREAVEAFAEQLQRVPGLDHHDWTAAVHRLTRSNRVVETGHPLTLYLTVLADLLDTATPTDLHTRMAGHGPEDRVLTHERRYWKRVAETKPALTPLLHVLDAIIATTILTPPQSTEDTATALRACIPELTDQPTHVLTAFTTVLTELFPSNTENTTGTLQPDRLAEHFAANHTLHSPHHTHRLATNATFEQATTVLTVLTRAVIHHPRHDQLAHHITTLINTHPGTLAHPALILITSVEHPAPLLSALQHTTTNPSTPIDVIVRLTDALPHTSVKLAPLAVTITQRLVDHHRTQPTTSLPHLAMSLNNLSNRLGDLGRWEEALGAITEAVDIRRRLAADRPDAFLPDLATSLNNLSVRLGDLRRQEEALAVITEAVKALRQLAADRPDAFLPDLATSLSNLSVLLGVLGYREEGLAAITEAAEVHRQLAAERPGQFLPNLALSLNNLSIRLGESGRPEEALTAITEAVEVYRRLANDRPDAFLPDLAMSLSNLSGRLGRLSRDVEALTAITEAVEVYRRLTNDRPDAFLPGLALSLNNLAILLGNLGHQEKGLAAITEAAEVHRQLATDRPDAFLPELALSLHNLAVRLGHMDRTEEGLAAITEAVGIRRRFAADRPDAFLPELATSLQNFAILLGESGRREEGLVAITEAVELRTDLAARWPTLHGSELQSSQRVLQWLNEWPPNPY